MYLRFYKSADLRNQALFRQTAFGQSFRESPVHAQMSRIVYITLQAPQFRWAMNRTLFPYPDILPQAFRREYALRSRLLYDCSAGI